MSRSLFLTTCASGALVIVALFGAGTPAVAAAPAAADKSEGAKIGELVVTDEKREQSPRSIPVGISVYTSDKQDQIGIYSVQRMINLGCRVRAALLCS